MNRCRYCGLLAATTVEGRDGPIPTCTVHEAIAIRSLAGMPKGAA